MRSPRQIESVSAVEASGPISRVIAPGGLGRRLKPFVFLDHLHADIQPGWGFDFHPHSGIATLTYQLDCDVAYTDTEGVKGILKAGGLEWMQSGGGAWHRGYLQGSGRVTGFQLWVALPPVLEDGPSYSLYVPPENVPALDGVKILLGEYERNASSIDAPSTMNLFDVELPSGRSWEFTPPSDHAIAWLYQYRGISRIGDRMVGEQLIVFHEDIGSIAVLAEKNCRFMFGSSPRHEYPLVNGPSSVHTNEKSLSASSDRIRERYPE